MAPPTLDEADISSESDDHPEPNLISTEEADAGQDDGADDMVSPSDGPSKPASNARDPSRPKRKKARRACHACQRAHLTCGDERPCGRCIKRGLQDSCHDGVRKKAKYLHDAPNEALMPGLGSSHFGNINQRRSSRARNPVSDIDMTFGKQQSYYSPTQAVPGQTYAAYPAAELQSPMTSVAPSQGAHQPPISPNYPSGQNQQSTPLSMYAGPLPLSSPTGQPQAQNAFGGPLLDAADPSSFNFDLASLNFGNHYGALEFGMLGHMSSAAMETPPPGDAAILGQAGSGAAEFPSSNAATTYQRSPTAANYPFPDGAVLTDWQAAGGSGQEVVEGGYPIDGGVAAPGRNPSVAHGYTIGAGSSAITSPEANADGSLAAFEDLPPQLSYYPSGVGTPQDQVSQQGQVYYQQQLSAPLSGLQQLQQAASRRPRDPSSIYESVTQPYSYTAGFHKLVAFLQKRFSAQKTLRIAKALASIRPSFISCTKTLNQEDLLFMEKCFQRTLWEYEDFINACATPTIVCRRTGEVAAVGKEFSILTGWKKDVLLGKEANLNINTGNSSSANGGGSEPGSRGFTTPRTLEGQQQQQQQQNGQADAAAGAKPQPVFLAALLDDDSVIKFFEDFAKLAFGDSRGSVMMRSRLLKYKTREDLEAAQTEGGPSSLKDENDGAQMMGPQREDGGQKGETVARGGGSLTKQNGGIAGESSIDRLESQDGTVECICCWTVKRDVFDIPMLIVMNFLPCI